MTKRILAGALLLLAFGFDAGQSLTRTIGDGNQSAIYPIPARSSASSPRPRWYTVEPAFVVTPSFRRAASN